MNSNEIRVILKEKDQTSWSSIKWQEDILSFIENNKDAGDTVVEIGCARGGNTCQLTNLCSRLGLNLFIVDTSPVYVEQTKSILEHFNYFGIKDRVTFYLKDFMEFSLEHKNLNIILVVHDADHTFNFVVKDIGALFRFNKLPHGIIFHDYNLRLTVREPANSYAILAVDFAIRYCFGYDVKINKVGYTESNPSVDTVINPSPVHSYYVNERSEGALISPLPKPVYVYGMETKDYIELIKRF